MRLVGVIDGMFSGNSILANCAKLLVGAATGMTLSPFLGPANFWGALLVLIGQKGEKK
jgi:hypothetical protein